MKKIQIAFLLIVLALASCKTASVPAAKHREAPESFTPSYAYFAQPTPARDTLFLLEDDNMSRITYSAWDSVPATKRPVIIFVPEKDMLCIKKRCNGSLK